MKLCVVGDDGYAYLAQLSGGAIVVRADPSAKIVVDEIVTRLGGVWTGNAHSNWMIHSDRAVALFDALYELAQRAAKRQPA